MALTAQAIITRVGRALKDEMNVQWTEAELLEHISDAQRATVLLKPESNPRYRVVRLAVGVRQEIPDDAHQLITATMNMGDGTTPGDAIAPATKASLDDAQRDWPRAAGADAVVENFVYDVRMRRHYYVYPPQPTVPGHIEIYFSKIPDEVMVASTNLELDATYLPALFAYTMHCAHLKDVDEEGQDVARASAYFEKFMTLLLGRADENEGDITIRNEISELNRVNVRQRQRQRQ